jgi:hypothetical protein
MSESNGAPKAAFDIGEAIAVPWTLPGGPNFLFRVIAWGTALLLCVYAIFGRSFMSAYGEFIKASLQLQNSGEQADPEEALALFELMGNLFPSAVVVMVLSGLVLTSMETALHKNGFRGVDKGAMPLRFGIDELRVLLAKIVVWIVMVVIYSLGIFVLVAVLGFFGKAFGSGAGVLIGVFVSFIAFLVLLIRSAMGLAPAAAMSVRDNRIRLFEGWGAVKGRAWPVFGTYFIVFFIGYFASYLIMGIGMYISFGNIDFLTVMTESPDDIDAVFVQMGEAISQPKTYIPLVIFTIIYAAMMLIWYVHIYGVAHYVARLDARDKGLV